MQPSPLSTSTSASPVASRPNNPDSARRDLNNTVGIRHRAQNLFTSFGGSSGRRHNHSTTTSTTTQTR